MYGLSYIRASLVGEDGMSREFIIDNEEFLDFIFEILDDADRINYATLDEPLKTSIRMCIDGEFEQTTPKPGLLKTQLEENGLECYCIFNSNKVIFNPRILNYIIYKADML